MEDLRYTLDLPAGRDRVWELWTTAEGLTGWLCERAVVEPWVGGAYELHFHGEPGQDEGAVATGCRVLSVDRPRLLEFEWRGTEELAGLMAAAGVEPTRCKLELSPRPSGTRLTLTHSGWGEGDDWAEARARTRRAWEISLERLLGVLAAEDAAYRRGGSSE